LTPVEAIKIELAPIGGLTSKPAAPKSAEMQSEAPKAPKPKPAATAKSTGKPTKPSKR
jgi:hypothetical protein